MQNVRCVSLILCSVAASVWANVELTTDDTTVQVLGQSGKIRILRDDETEDSGITVTMSGIFERDAAGDNVGFSGPSDDKHVKNSFASTEFVFGDIQTSDISGVSADVVPFVTRLVGDVALLNITTYVFTEDGSIVPTDGSERFNVTRGAIKFNIELYDWPFCDGADGNPCKGATGEFVDVEIEVKSKDDLDNFDERAVEDDEESFPLGAGEDIYLSKLVQKDGVWEQMADGFPKVALNGNKYTFLFRLPKFVNSVLYDPVIERSEDEPSSSTSSGGGKSDGGSGGSSSGSGGGGSGSKSSGDKDDYQQASSAGTPAWVIAVTTIGGVAFLAAALGAAYAFVVSRRQPRGPTSPRRMIPELESK